MSLKSNLKRFFVQNTEKIELSRSVLFIRYEASGGKFPEKLGKRSGKALVIRPLPFFHVLCPSAGSAYNLAQMPLKQQSVHVVTGVPHPVLT